MCLPQRTDLQGGARCLTLEPSTRTRHSRRAVVARWCACVIDHGWTIEATADRFQVDAKTVRKWRDRFLAEGEPRSARSVEPTENVTERDTCRRVGVGSSSYASSAAGVLPTSRHEVGHRGFDGPEDLDRRRTRPTRLEVTEQPPSRFAAINVIGPVSWSMSMSRRSSGIPDGGGWRIHGRGQRLHTGQRSTSWLPVLPLRAR